MELIISGRRLDVSDDLRDHIEGAVSKLAEEYPKLTTARVVLEIERNWQIVEAHVQGKHLHLDATSRTQDMYVSVDDVIDKLEKQLRRHLDRLRDHHPNHGELPTETSELEAGDDLEEDLEFEEEAELV